MQDPKIPLPLDEALRMEAANTQVASYNSAALDLDWAANSQWTSIQPDLGGIPAAIVCNVTALNFGTLTGTLTPTFSQTLQQSPDGTAWTAASPSVAITTTGVNSLVFGFVNQRYVRRAVTITPNVNAGGSLGGAAITSDSGLAVNGVTAR